jgi:hypothetical protein
MDIEYNKIHPSGHGELKMYDTVLLPRKVNEPI